MTKMNRFFAMAMAAAMLTGTTGTMNSFAEENDRHQNCEGVTVTDIDVTVDAGMEGSHEIEFYGADPDDIEDDIIDKTGKESVPKIYVEVEWDELKFVYDFGTVVEYDWQIADTKYEAVYEYANGESEGWNKESAWIKFTNYSNRPVYTGVSFEKNPDTPVYDDVSVTFDYDEIDIESAAGRGPQTKEINMFVEGRPLDTLLGETEFPALGALKFYISETSRFAEPTQEEEPAAVVSGEHEHHFVYDQFGRLVCTGCNEIAHEYCVDFDEDGICDECGLERDFCEDCHVGGKCVCT